MTLVYDCNCRSTGNECGTAGLLVCCQIHVCERMMGFPLFCSWSVQGVLLVLVVLSIPT